MWLINVYGNSGEGTRAWLLCFVKGIEFESHEDNLNGCKEIWLNLSLMESTTAINV